MRLSKSIWQTYKEIPADAEIASHQLMIRAGLIHKVGSGLYNYMPFGYRSIRKVEQIIREELDKIDCQEILMTVVTPGELWQESGRWEKMGGEMLKFKDKGERDLCISPTNEETVTDIFRKIVKSYKQLPLTLYQINTKFRDEIRPRFGLMRGREFTMKDAYSFHMDKSSLDKGYQELFDAYCAIFNRIGLEFSAVEADAGAMAEGDAKTHEFQVIANSGEDQIIYCEEENYAANAEKAETIRGGVEFNLQEAAIGIVDTPNKTTIEEVCAFLSLPQQQSLKSLVYYADIEGEDHFILCLLLGDDSLNELKLRNILACQELRPATDSELLKLNLVKGFIGPKGLAADKMRVIYDQAINRDAYYITGANQEDKHFENFCPARDGMIGETADLRMAVEGDYTLSGAHQIQVKRGIEVGHIFQLGDLYTKALGVKVLDQNGKTKAPLMGCYGIGVTRVVAAAIEQGHDENGIIWPKSIAPFHVYFALVGKSEEIKNEAEKIYQELLNAGIEVLFDDRNAGAGFKFKDSDLLGLPLRLVLGERNFKENGQLELIMRSTGEKELVSPEGIATTIQQALDKLEK